LVGNADTPKRLLLLWTCKQAINATFPILGPTSQSVAVAQQTKAMQTEPFCVRVV